MARDRDWVDYVNLGANVAQTAQLGSINSKMRQMAALKFQKEYREQQETAEAKCEDVLRDAVFFYSEQLRDLEEVASQNPVTAYVRASHLKGTYERMPQFTASGFRRFEDKERLANVQRACDRLIRESAARLKPAERENCDRCITYIFERDDLLRLIADQEQKKQLAAKQAHLQRRIEEYHYQDDPLVIKLRNFSGVCFAIGVVWGVILILCFATRGADPPPLLMQPLWLLVMFPVLFLLEIIVVANRPSRRKQAIEKELAREEAEINVRILELSQRESALYAKFGKTDSEGYRKMLQERDDLLVQVLGDFAKVLKGTVRPATNLPGAESRKPIEGPISKRQPRSAQLLEPPDGWWCVNYKGDRFFTNRAIIVKGEPPASHRKSRQNLTESIWVDLLERVTFQPVDAEAFSTLPDGTEVIRFTDSTVIPAFYYDYFTSNHPKLLFFSSGRTSQMKVADSNGNLIGLVMPLKLS
jgi:hypothetical protein